MNIRVSGTEARWSLREAAWELEERVLWPGVDRVQDAADRVAVALAPVQQVVETRVAWPLADGLRRSGSAAKAGVASVMISAAVGASWAGASMSGDPAAIAERLDPRPIGTLASPPSADDGAERKLLGASPSFASDRAAKAVAVAPPVREQAEGRRARTVTEADGVTTAEKFSKAFVAYEIGKADDAVIASFAELATPALAKALKGRPPRLPADAEVPRARVVNVLVGKRGKRRMEISVALARLESVSEIRLTLIRAKDRWRVSEVLG